ncbi:HNH endonuclease [Aeromonas phage vB_AsaP_MQM1]|nr:HNH endonuclease [Aeromonas phage vB_AsaP_MQM1]
MKKHIRERIAERLLTNENGCDIWQGTCTRHGHGQIWFEGKMVAPYRILYSLEHPDIDLSSSVLWHTCGNPHCCTVGHLKVLPKDGHIQRVKSCVRHTTRAGERNPSTKLSDEDAHSIKYHFGDYTAKQLAELFDVSVPVILSIRAGRTWQHI